MYVCIYTHTYIRIYSKTPPNRPNMRPSLNGPFREAVAIGSLTIPKWCCVSNRLGPK